MDGEAEGEAKMGDLKIYRVIIETPNGEEGYQREYVGPATSEDDAVKQARTVFEKRADDRLLTVEVVDLESWAEDTILRPTGTPR